MQRSDRATCTIAQATDGLHFTKQPPVIEHHPSSIACRLHPRLVRRYIFSLIGSASPCHAIQIDCVQMLAPVDPSPDRGLSLRTNTIQKAGQEPALTPLHSSCSHRCLHQPRLEAIRTLLAYDPAQERSRDLEAAKKSTSLAGILATAGDKEKAPILLTAVH
jgi:hypothetical protein